MKYSTATRIILADDHLFFRVSFKRVIRSNDQIEIVAEATNGQELVEFVGKYQPHVVITDINMPGMDGIEATRIITHQFPGTRVIALSEAEDPDSIKNMIAAGAYGYLGKSSSCEEILETIHRVRAGD